MKQYQIVVVNLDPTIGREMKKTRPCLILSPNEMNDHLGTVTIAPITSQEKPYPSRVFVKNDRYAGWVVLDQVRTISRQRVVATDGYVDAAEIDRIKTVLRKIFVD